MEYRLINGPFKKEYAFNLLRERGIEDIEKFLSPDRSVLNSPKNLINIEDGIDVLLKTIKNPNHKIVLVVDCDVDGFTSSTIIWQYLHKICPEVNISYELHDGKQHGLVDITQKIFDRSEIPDLIIVPDAGSNDYEEHRLLKNSGIITLVLDHHETPYLSDDGIIINNQLSPNYNNKELTGAGVAWQFCRQLDEVLGVNYSNDFIDLVALGLVSDMASVTTLENRYIIKEGFSNINNLFFRAVVEKQDFSLKGKVTPIGVSFYIAPLINAVMRAGTMNEKEKLFLAFIDGTQIVDSTKRGEKGMKETLITQMARECTNIRARQNKVKEKVVDSLEIKIAKNNLLDNKILFIRLDDEDDFPSELNGSTLLAR